jgi:hypothetical protein
MDMWPAYINSTLEHVPQADEKIVFDRFHIMMHVSRAVDTVRKQEHRQLAAEDDARLKGTKYLWLYSKENLPEHRRAEFKALFNQDLKVGWGGPAITDGLEFVISVLGLCSVSSRIPAVKDSSRTSVCDAGYTMPRSR